MKLHWSIEPFPYTVLDNFLPIDEFELLNYELDNTNNLIQSDFRSPLESKSIYKDTFCKEVAQKLIRRMASKEIKNLIVQQTGDVEIISIGESIDFAPYHITNNNGYLGAHIDHSFIENGQLRHIANTIFYASNRWQKGWGGETILFSRNGLRQKVLIEPIPNRMIIFIHTANSFHGVTPYFSTDNIERRTFYHDYYVKESNINLVMDNLNLNRTVRLTHNFHGTTFIPFFPFGLDQLNWRTIIDIKNLNYIQTFLVYLSNRYFGTRIISIRNSIKYINKVFVRKVRGYFIQ